MSRLARILLALYPPAWRERYRAEYEALLDDHGIDACTLADILRGALDAHLRELAATSTERRRRTALAACLWGVAAAAVAVAGFAKMVEYDDFTAAASRHAPVAAGRDLIYAGAVVVALAVGAAGVVVARALGNALLDGRPGLGRPLAVAAAAAGVVVLGPVVVGVYARSAPHRPPHDPRTLAVVIGWLAVSALAGAVGLAAAGRVLGRVPLTARALGLAMGAARTAAAGLCVIACGLVVWGVALANESDRVFNLPGGGLLSTATPLTWAGLVALGVGGAAVALLALRHAGGASPRPRSAPSSPASPPPAARSSSSG
jgi:hypothetical protein